MKLHLLLEDISLTAVSKDGSMYMNIDGKHYRYFEIFSEVFKRQISQYNKRRGHTIRFLKNNFPCENLKTGEVTFRGMKYKDLDTYLKRRKK